MTRLVPSRGTWRTVAVALGVSGVALAATLWFAPGVVPPAVRAPLAAIPETLGGRTVTWGLAGAAGLYALVRAAGGRRRPPVAPEFVDRPPERPRGRVPAVGEGFERTVAGVGREAEDPREVGDPVRERLRATAVTVLERKTGRTRAAARRAVAAGTWTDDRVAAAFLGGEDAPQFTLPERLRGWIHPGRTFRHRVERTVAALADAAAPTPGAGPREDDDGGPSRATADAAPVDGEGGEGGQGGVDGREGGDGSTPDRREGSG